MPARIEFDIPKKVLARYQCGAITLDVIAEEIGVSEHAVLRKLRELGIDTSMRTRKRLQFARQLEAAQNLRPGTAYETIAKLYRKGYSLNKVAERLGCNSRAAWLILGRQRVPVRPQWYRQVFRDAAGRLRNRKTFGPKLRSLRLARGWSQQSLGNKCGLSQKTFWHLEAGVYGPHWETLFKLAKALDVDVKEFGVTWSSPV